MLSRIQPWHVFGVALMLVLVVLHGAAQAATGSDGRWHPGIGDPTPMGWITVVAYGLSAALCWRCARQLPAPVFWWGITAALLLLGLNKQLDLQTWFTQWGRDMARRDGWYAQRHHYQVVFIAIMGSVCLAAVLAMALALRRHWLAYLWVWSGTALLLFFIVARAASFHHVDALLMSELGGVRLNWVFELGGLAMISVGAWHLDAKAQKNPPG
jgi:hypothetical protein